MNEPVLLALLFADRVITEDNGKKGIIGTFTRFGSETFPVTFPPWAIYACITNIQGKHTFAFDLVKRDSGEIVFPIQGEFQVNHMEEPVELTINLNGVTFQEEGYYNLLFKIDNEIAGSRILIVDKRKP